MTNQDWDLTEHLVILLTVVIVFVIQHWQFRRKNPRK